MVAECPYLLTLEISELRLQQTREVFVSRYG